MTFTKSRLQMALKYEPTISLGNTLVALAMLGSVSMIWTTNQREIERTQGQIEVVKEGKARQDIEIRDMRNDTQLAIRELRVDIKELSQSVGVVIANQAVKGR